MGQKVSAQVKDQAGDKLLSRGDQVTAEVLETLNRQQILQLPMSSKGLLDTVEDIYRRTDSHIEVLHRVKE